MELHYIQIFITIGLQVCYEEEKLSTDFPYVLHVCI